MSNGDKGKQTAAQTAKEILKERAEAKARAKKAEEGMEDLVYELSELTAAVEDLEDYLTDSTEDDDG